MGNKLLGEQISVEMPSEFAHYWVHFDNPFVVQETAANTKWINMFP